MQRSNFSEPEMMRIFRALPNSYLILDGDLVIVEASDACLAMAETRRADMIGRPASEVLPAELVASFDRMRVDPCPETLPPRLYDIRHPEGAAERRCWRVVNIPILDGGRLTHILSRIEDAPDHARIDIVTDDHGFRQANEALHESQQRLRAIADNLPSGFVYQLIMSRDGTERWFGYVSQSVERVTGVSVDAAMSGSAALYDQIVPAYRQMLARAEAVSIEMLEPFNKEAQFIRSDGSLRWCRIISAPRVSPDGAWLIWDGLFIDVTEQKEAEQAARASDVRLRLALAAAGMAVWEYDHVSDVVTHSPELNLLLGLPVDRTITLDELRSRCHPDDQGILNVAAKAAIERGVRQFQTEFRIMRAEGDACWLLLSAEFMRDASGAATGAIGVLLDITKRKLAETVLRESEERFRLIADSAPVPMWVSLLDGRREFVNQAYVDFLGQPYETALNFDWRRLLHPDDLPRIMSLQASGELSKASFTLEARYLRRDGQWRWLRSESQPRWGPDGAHIGFVGVAYDVTEARQAEADLRRLNELLEERVAAALAEKSEAEDQLRQMQKMQALGELTGGIAHDFNNLLTVIQGSADLLRRPDLPDEKRLRHLDAIVQTTERAAALTNQLLAFARRQPLRPEALDLDLRIDAMVDLLRRTLGEHIQVKVDLASDLWPIEVDPTQLESAILNLCVNARDAMEDGGVLTIRAANNGQRSRADGTRGDFVWLSISDTGIGMNRELVDRAFEPFFTTKGVGKGTGLGLSQVYGFAMQSGGDAWIDSAPGKGTTATLSLPRAAASPLVHAADATRASSSYQLTGTSILLVEDNPHVAAFAQGLLEELGATVLRAENAERALELMQSAAHVDLIFSDVVMPGMSGIELGREIRRRYPHLPVVLTSGYSEALTEDEGRDLPVLAKPYRIETLADALHGAMKAPATA